MRRWSTALICLAALLTVTRAHPARAGDAEAIARHRHQRAIEALGQAGGDAALEQFAREHLAPGYRDSMSKETLDALLGSIRSVAANAGGVLFARDGDVSRVRFMSAGGETSVAFRMQNGVPYLITSLEIESGAASQGPQVEPITWETLESRLDREAKNGFSGALMVVRGGRVVLDRGYGFADRGRRIKNTPDTIFAIGSTPIDFTRAAILELEDLGKLKTSEPISTYLARVPDDKRGITIDQLMSGRSGLADFHHIPGVDADPDLTWIDRDTAVKRILDGRLLFEPGSDRKHSHSAWVLLAAIVEIVSGETYGQFVKDRLFKPAGMMRTGLHEDLARVDDRGIAIGYDAQAAGDVNSPKHWGRTSWLVMGSGGMNSTPRDLYRFFTAVRGAKILSEHAAKKYGAGGGVMVGGDDRGFLCMHGEKGGDMFFLCSNAHSGPGDRAWGVGKRLAELVLGEPGN